MKRRVVKRQILRVASMYETLESVPLGSERSFCRAISSIAAVKSRPTTRPAPAGEPLGEIAGAAGNIEDVLAGLYAR